MAYTHYTKEELISIIQLKDEQINELQTDFDTVAESVLNFVDGLGALKPLMEGKEISTGAIIAKVTLGRTKLLEPLNILPGVLKKYAVRYQDILG
jgi:hypothetical protein